MSKQELPSISWHMLRNALQQQFSKMFLSNQCPCLKWMADNLVYHVFEDDHFMSSCQLHILIIVNPVSLFPQPHFTHQILNSCITILKFIAVFNNLMAHECQCFAV